MSGEHHNAFQWILILTLTLTLVAQCVYPLSQDAVANTTDRGKFKKMKGYGEKYGVYSAIEYSGDTAPDDIVKSVLHMYLENVIYKGKIKPLEFFVIKNGSYGNIGSPAMFIMGVEISFRRPFGMGVSAPGGGASAPEGFAPGGVSAPGGCLLRGGGLVRGVWSGGVWHPPKFFF